jgi:hypothetical protein
MDALRLMFDWGGGCLWCAGAPTLKALGVGPVEKTLPLPQAPRDRLDAFSARHDTALNWLSPADPGPWAARDHARFDAAARALLADLTQALGPEYDLRYAPLGDLDAPNSPLAGPLA